MVGIEELANGEVTADRGVSSKTRQHRRRRSRSATPLPGGRAVVGGFLIALSVLGLLAAQQAADAPPRTRYAVADHDLVPGDRLTTSDLRMVAIDLPTDMAARAFSSPGALEGATVLAAVGAGELVQVASVVVVTGPEGHRQLSFPIETDLALGGRLRPGELVDVVATFGSGGDAETVIVARSVPVVRAESSDGGVRGRFTVVTVALVDDESVLSVAHAVRAGQIVLVRATGAAPVSVAVDNNSERGEQTAGDGSG